MVVFDVSVMLYISFVLGAWGYLFINHLIKEDMIFSFWGRAFSNNNPLKMPLWQCGKCHAGFVGSLLGLCFLIVIFAKQGFSESLLLFAVQLLSIIILSMLWATIFEHKI